VNASRPFGALDYDQPDDTDTWRWKHVALFVVATGFCWATAWVASGFAPLVALASGFAPRTERR
jgi:hypothetical protein